MSAWFLFSVDLNTNVDFSDFILVKYITNLTSENKKNFKSQENKGNLTENHAKISK